MNRYLGFVGMIFLTLCFTFAQGQQLPPYLQSAKARIWADSLLGVMTPEQKVGQLFMISAYSNKDEAHAQEIENYIKQYQIGGLIFMQGNPESQLMLTNRFQAISPLPLMMGIDGEWGLSMRLQNTIQYQKQIMLGAITNDSLIYDMGREFARQMKRLGIHVNFAPDIDVNVNPANPVINDRSFGENIYNVTRKGNLYMRGMQDGGLLACGKHFPGHGDTDVDSHYDLPVIEHGIKRLDSIELYPFKAMVNEGIGSLMVSHLHIPSLDPKPNMPATLSPKIVQAIIRDQMQYQGLIFTDAMNMKGVAKFFPSGKAEVMALLAGNDIMLFPDNVKAAIDGVLSAMKDSTLSQELIDDKVRRILMAKYWMGLSTYKPISPENLMKDINSVEAQFLKEKIAAAAITALSNRDNLLPIEDFTGKKIASLTIGMNGATPFTNMLDKYRSIDHFYIDKESSPAEFEAMSEQLKSYDIAIIAVQNMSRFATKKFGLTENSVQFLQKIKDRTGVLIVVFGNPYSLERIKKSPNLLLAYNDDEETQSFAAQIIFGGRSAIGRLPVSTGGYKYAAGFNTLSGIRLRYANPLELGIPATAFDKIDKIAKEAIDMGATPGCQVLVAKDGAVIYEKAFGKHTYNENQPVKKDDIYDLASITKVTASAPMLMYLYDKGQISLDKTLGDYLPLSGSNKKSLTLKNILTHQSGLQAWIPFFKGTLDANGKPDSNVYRSTPDSIFSSRINNTMYMRKDYIDTMYKILNDSELKEKTYRYSDLGYYYFKKIIEQKTHTTLDKALDSLVWGRLGGNLTMYNPNVNGFNPKRVVPTENDVPFRGGVLRGDVHDPGAAMIGGVGGHAGLFSNANDLAKYFQMLLNDGSYGGVQYFKPSTVKEFTQQQFTGNRRALAFDKPALNGDGPTCDAASRNSFGHTGFTGTIAWADPDNDLIYIFLSNRVYPSGENKLLQTQNIRPRIQEVIYEAVK